MAELPKAVFVLLASVGLIISIAMAATAEDVETDSNVLQPVFDLIDANASANPADQESLRADFENAVTLGVLTPEEALAMLELVQWETLEETDDLANVSATIQTILDDLILGTLTEDPLTALTELLNVLATPTGTLTAIGNAGASEDILDQVSSLVASGVPPGILVRIVKQGLQDGLSMEEIAVQLDALAVAVSENENLSWGQIANDITDKGENKHQDQEQNANIGGNEEPEQEENEHGNSSGKKDDNPGKGQGKDKDK